MFRNAGIVLSVVIGSTVLVGGCGTQPGSSTMTYSRTAKMPPPLTKVSDPGKYAVYASDGTTPIWSGELSSGDEYGFMKNDAGKVVGVVKMSSGESTNIPLDNWLATSYVWKYQGMKKM